VPYYSFDRDTSDQFISISHSPKGWTDQELGEMWIKKDFEPATAARNTSGGYCLLILDGHNSHCTYGFCKFAADHDIIVICLPSHTTHALQPCDVACFGPLASAWKSEVNSASADYVEITKQNLLVFYAKARERALKPSTIISAFAKTGIWPFNRHVLEPSAFEPSKNTTTEPAQPLPARLPTLLIPICDSADRDAPDAENGVRYIIPLPPALPHTASRKDLYHENQMFRNTLRLAEVQLEKDFTQMKLMDSENGRLRKRAYTREKKKTEKRETTQAHARLMTGEENLNALAEKDFMRKWKDVVKELAPTFKQIRGTIGDHEKQMAQAAKNADRARKEQERATKKALAAAEKAKKKAAREEAAAARKAACGSGRGWRRGNGGARRGGARVRGRGKGGNGIGMEVDSEVDDLDGQSSSAESDDEDELPESSDSPTSAEQDQHDAEYEVVAPGAPHFPLSPTKQVVKPRPRPRPTFRIPEAGVDVANEAEDREHLEGFGGPQSQIAGVLIEDRGQGEAGKTVEGENVEDSGRRYPRRSNRSNARFVYGIDA
jgi:DDE superfamily endonuclease